MELRLPVRYALVGFTLGVAIRVLPGDTLALPRGTVPPNPDVVVLNSEKRVTIEKPSLTLNGLAKELAKHTGRRFTVEKPFRDDKKTYAVIVGQAPLGRILDAISYVSGGRWERRGALYRLRPPTPREAVTDSGRYVATLDTLREYLTTVDSDDLSLPEGVRVELANFRQEFAAATADPYWPPPVPEDVMGDWQVRSKEHGLAITFRNVDKRDDGETGTWHTWSWGWQNAK